MNVCQLKATKHDDIFVGFLGYLQVNYPKLGHWNRLRDFLSVCLEVGADLIHFEGVG